MKDFIKKYKKALLGSASILIILLIAFWYGGDSPDSKGWNIDNSKSQSSTSTSSNALNDEIVSDFSSEVTSSTSSPNQEFSSEQAVSSKVSSSDTSSKNIVSSTDKDTASSENKDKKNVCTISISCETVLKNMELLEKGKEKIVPSDGIILSQVKAEFEEGETVFDILKRVCKENKIHLEYTNTPIYNTAYIEGINNLYEFDCGSLSGWIYSVNGEFQSKSCSLYKVKKSDEIKFVYTCNLGNDVGGGYN